MTFSTRIPCGRQEGFPIAKKGKFSQPRKREEAELEEAFRQVTDAANGYAPTGKAPRAGSERNYDSQYDDSEEDEEYEEEYDEGGSGPNKKKVIAIVLAVALVVVLALGGGVWYFMAMTADDGLIYDNVFAGPFDLGGLTPQQAIQALHDCTDDSYTQKNLLVTLPDTQLVLTPEQTGAKLDVEKLVNDAYGFGRDGSRWENFQAKTQSALSRHDMGLLNYLTLDTQYIRQQVDQLAADAASVLTQATVSIDGEMPELDQTYEVASQDDSIAHMTLTIVTGTPERNLDADDLYEQILAAYESNDFTGITVQYHVAEPDPVDLQKVYDENRVPATDAVLNESDYTITPELLGYDFDLEEARKLLEEAEYGQEIAISFRFTAPEVTMMDLQEYLFQDKLASYSSDHSVNSNRTQNLILACQAIDGTIIRPGEVFSFNDVVGQRTAEKGYKAASVYSGGETVDQLGGGVCQVASTIYYVAMLADMEIVEREEHMFLVTYVPRGMDATIYWGSYDFKFRNNTKYPIRIDASTHDGQCHIAIYGTDDKDYYVKMTYETVSGPNGGEEEIKEIKKSNNPKGYYDGQVIQTAYSGYTIKTYRQKYDKKTDQLISSEWEATSVFSSRNRIVVKLVDDETEPTTEPTTAPTTQPPTTEPPTTEPPTTEPPTEAPTEAPTEESEPEPTEGGE